MSEDRFRQPGPRFQSAPSRLQQTYRGGHQPHPTQSHSGYYPGSKQYIQREYHHHSAYHPHPPPPYRPSPHANQSPYDPEEPTAPERSVFYVILSSDCRRHTGPGLFAPEMAHKINLKTSTHPDRIITYTAAQLKKKQAEFHLWNLSSADQNSARIVNYFTPQRPGVLSDINGKFLFAEERGVGTLFPNYAPVFQQGQITSASICLKYYNKQTKTCSFVSVMSGFWNQKVSRWLPFARRLLVLDEDEDLWFYVEQPSKSKDAENSMPDIVPLDLQTTPAEFGLVPGSIVIATDIGVTPEDILEAFKTAAPAPSPQQHPTENLDFQQLMMGQEDDHDQQQQLLLQQQSVSSKYVPKQPSAPVPVAVAAAAPAPAPAPAPQEVAPPQPAPSQSQSQSQAQAAGLKTLLESHLECPICFEMMFPPIFQCASGHCLCNSCHTEFRKQGRNCPTCNVPFDFEKPIRALVLETLAEHAGVPYPCRYKANGCDCRMPKLELVLHEESCVHRKLICPAHGTECKAEQTVTYANVVSHLENFHQVQQFSSSSSSSNGPNSTEALIEFSIPNTAELSMVKLLRIIDNSSLILFATRSPSVGLSIYARCVTATTSNISYVATVLSPRGLTFSFGGPALEIGATVDEAVEGPCLTLSPAMMKHLCSPQQNSSEQIPVSVYLKWTINPNQQQ